MNKNEIYRIYGTNYKEMTVRLLTECNLSAQIMGKFQRPIYPSISPEIPSSKSFISDMASVPDRSNIRIGIKPNLVSPTPASFGATTHPEIVTGIIEYLQMHGFTNITILEGSWVGDRTSEAFEYCGYNELSRKYNVPLFDMQKDTSFTADCSGLQLKICSKLQDIDYLINVPVLKGHCQTRVTCALKNMKGLIPNSEKRHFHSMGLHKPIAHLNTYIHQDFIVIDHICGDPDIEDGGNPLVRNCIMAAVDPVLTDAYACRVLGYSADDVRYITLAAGLGVGSSDLGSLHMINVPGDEDSIQYEELERQFDKTDEDSSEISDAHRIVSLNYAVEEVDSCSACYSYLMSALDRLKSEGLLSRLTDELNIRFCIGQGYRRSGDTSDDANNACMKHHSGTSESSSPCTESECLNYIGIGACTRAFEKNIPGCPPSEDDIYDYLVNLLP